VEYTVQAPFVLFFLFAVSNDIIAIIIITTFMQGIYNYMPEANRVSRIYSVTANLWLQYMVHVMLFHVKCSGPPATR
jgi:hypothetical protein